MASKGDIRAALYDLFTDTPVKKVAAKRKVSVQAVYLWRVAAVGKTSKTGYAGRVKAFVAEVAKELGGEAKPLNPRGRGAPRKPTAQKPKAHHTRAFKEEVVHVFVNQGRSIRDVAEAHDISHQLIYAWRAQLLGQKSDPKFGDKALALAKKFMTEARVSDQMNGREMPESPMAAASTMLTEVVADGQREGGLESLSDKLAELDQMAAEIAKDRQIVTLNIEVQQLRRQLNDR